MNANGEEDWLRRLEMESARSPARKRACPAAAIMAALSVERARLGK